MNLFRHISLQFPVTITLLLAARTVCNAGTLVGVWREAKTTNTISFTTNSVRLSPLFKLNYRLESNSVIFQKPSRINLDRLKIEVRTNATIFQDTRSHLEGPFSDVVVPFTLTNHILQLDWGTGWEQYVQLEDKPVPTRKDRFAGKLQVVISVSQKEVRLNEPFKVDLRVENVSRTNQIFQVMNCSWDEHWRSSNPDLSWLGWDCGKNFAVDINLGPHQAYTNQLQMLLTKMPKNGKASFKMSFEPVESAPLRSNKATITVKP